MAQDVVGSYLNAADRAVPGLVEGLYLEGSVALGDFRPHTSDVDFVAVTAQRPDPAAIAALERVHALMRGRPFFDGSYLTWDDLAGNPADAVPGPHSHEGRFHAGWNGHNPVTWHTIARYGVACRGPHPADRVIWADPDVLATWTKDNLDSYWRKWLEHSIRLLHPYAVVWLVTGVTRLHYTLATGDITSKDGAGRYALQTFPERWHRIAHEALRLRRGEGGRSLYLTPLARRRDALAFGHMVINDALK